MEPMQNDFKKLTIWVQAKSAMLTMTNGYDNLEAHAYISEIYWLSREGHIDMPKGACLRFLSVDLFRTLIAPKEDIALSYAKFGQCNFDFKFEPSTISTNFMKAYADLETQWPNFGSHDSISPQRWWNETIVRTIHRSSPFPEATVRNVLNLQKTNEIFDKFATADAWELEPNTIEGLKELSETGLEMCVLSNSDKRTPVLVNSLKIDKFFKFVFYSASCAFMKPDVGIFNCVISMFCEGSHVFPNDLNARKHQYAHVGDSISRDYFGAHNAGCGGAYLLKPRIECGRDDTIEEEHKKGQQIMSDSFTTWAWKETNPSRVPSRHVVHSLSELAYRLQLHNRVAIQT